ncbi:hypothetical protein A2U01_0089217, partial [Trifolium medium]|nr:hypothetical protein [Trifolium medium]
LEHLGFDAACHDLILGCFARTE